MEINHQVLATRVATKATDDQKKALIPWLQELLYLKHAKDIPPQDKAKRALKITADSKVILPILEMIAIEAGLAENNGTKIKFKEISKLLGSLTKLWDKQSLPSKLGLGASAIALALFGSQGAGIAALGTAIGVPLWVVFGAGGAWAGIMLEQLTGRPAS